MQAPITKTPFLKNSERFTQSFASFIMLLYLTQVSYANITVNYNNQNNSWTTSSMAAFDKAIEVWNETIYSPFDIKIDAYYEDFASTGAAPTNVLAFAFANATASNFGSNHPAYFADHTYVVSLAEKLRNTEYTSWSYNYPYHIEIRMNSGKNWNYSISFDPTANHYDFISVALHEIAHGLGFTSSASLNNSTSLPEYNEASPYIMDKYVVRVNNGTVDLTSLAGSGTATEEFLTSDQVFLNSSFAGIANGSSKPQLYAPTTWSQGSSISHWDQGYFSNTDHDALMHPQAAFSAASFHRHIGDVTTGYMRDIGWDIWPLGLEFNGADELVRIYPNPSSTGLFNILGQDEFELKVLTLDGRTLIDSEGILNSSYQIDMTEYPDGIYLLQSRINQRIFNLKLLKTN